MFSAPVLIIRTTPGSLAALAYADNQISHCNIPGCSVTSYPLWYRYFPEVLQFMYFMELHCILVNLCCYMVQQN